MANDKPSEKPQAPLTQESNPPIKPNPALIQPLERSAKPPQQRKVQRHG
jgi:hypothetical protein